MDYPFASRFTNAVAHVWAEDGVVCLTWRPGVRQLPDFQAAMETVLGLLQQLGTGKALVDQRAMAPLSPAEHTWVVTNWLPRATARGQYRYAAVLPARDPAASQAVLQVRTHHLHAPGAPLYQDFADEAPARHWLHRQVTVESQP